ncbi:MAG: group 1 glycosyl transferase [Acidobacteria bacterium]|nr:MAG: group 1 glycosyl transferase [Acidobacteriota bacterium]
MKICLVTAFPPSKERLNEYGFHLAEQLRRKDYVSLTVLADQTPEISGELPGFDIVRCWKFNSITTPWDLLKTILQIKPDVVWFNLVFSSFGDKPVPAFLGLCSALLLRLAGFYTHITLHHIIETLDLSRGTRFPGLYRFCGAVATRLLLCCNSISVLLPSYRKVLLENYRGRNIHLSKHGVFAPPPEFPDISKRGHPEHRILAFGKWGTYKRLEVLIEAFTRLAQRLPNIKLVIAGSNHPATPGYIECVRDRWKDNPCMEFHGYLPEDKIADLFIDCSVLVLPYSSAGGPSGVAHQACEFAVPIVASDLPDFRDMADAAQIAIEFFESENPGSLAETLERLLTDPARRIEMAEQNFAVALRMTMQEVVSSYVYSFSRALALSRTLSRRGKRSSKFWLEPTRI